MMHISKIPLFTIPILLTASIVLLCACSNDDSNDPITTWQKIFNADSAKTSAYSVQQTNDGGYIVAGSFDEDWEEFYILKTNSDGDELWHSIFGDKPSAVHRSDMALSVKQTSEGGYIAVGVLGYYGRSDLYLVKANSEGHKVWDMTFGDSDCDVGTSVQETVDGGYIVTGYTEVKPGDLDICLIKIDSGGNESWSKTFGDSSTEKAHSVQETADGGYVISGVTWSFGADEGDAYLIKTDANGNELWNQTYGGAGTDMAKSVSQTSDGGYVLAGVTTPYDSDLGSSDVYLMKVDSHGEELWSKTFGGSEFDSANSIDQTSDDGYIITGVTRQFSRGLYDVYLLKTDSEGNELWHRTFGDVDRNDEAFSVQLTSDGGYIIGATSYDYRFDEGWGNYLCNIYLIKTDSEGNCEHNLSPSNSHIGKALAMESR